MSKTLLNAKNIPLDAIGGTIPQMGAVLADWFQKLVFGLITKTIIGFQVQETITEIHFWGVAQPSDGRNLDIRPTGQRKWDWIKVSAQAAPNDAILEVNPDDMIEFQGLRYRVMSKKDYSLNGVVEYELVEAYLADVPTP